MATTLYPPIIKTSMPVFSANDEKMKIYFALSSFTSKNDIKQVHVVVRYRDTNTNALSSAWPAGIMTCNLNEENANDNPVIAATEERFYIELKTSDLDGGFKQDILYKVQIRFSGTYIENTSPKLSDFTTLSSYSEWSTVCLIKPVAPPDVEILEFSAYRREENAEVSDMVYASINCQFNLVYSAGGSLETLKHWRIKLYNEDESELLADSGLKIANNYDYNIDDSNKIICECLLPYQLINGDKYILEVETESKNGYLINKEYSFIAEAIAGQQLNARVSFSINEDEGYAKVLVVGQESSMSTNVTLQRTSSKSEFKIWEDVGNITVTNESLNWEFDDFTIESGIFYQYGAQTRDSYDRRGPRVLSERQMGEFDDAFLVESGGSLENAKQLKLKYNFNISNANVSVGESKTDTIGSKYPFIRRNGNMYYRTFQCSGLITAFMDNGANLFTNSKILYSGYQDVYDSKRAISDLRVNSYDYTYEKEFRKAVVDFLYNDKVKLFKSLQEGNMLVKVMNVSLTPKTELGRLLYDFSATFVEVDEANLLNFDKYNIQIIGTYQTKIDFENTQLGQLNSYLKPFDAGTDFIDRIGKKFHYRETIDDVKIQDFYISYFRIEFESPPYLINKTTLVPINDTDISSQISFDENDLVLGWVLNIGGNNILIAPPNNIYELKGENIRFNSSFKIITPKKIFATVDFLIGLSKSLDISRTPISYIYKNVMGQLRNGFTSSDNIISKIWYKYYIDLYEARSETGDRYYQKMKSINTINIDADPGAIVYVKSNLMSQLSKFIINETGELFLDPGLAEASISDLYLKGYQIDTRYIYPIYNAEEDGVSLFYNKHYKENLQSVLNEYDFYENQIFYHGQLRNMEIIEKDENNRPVIIEIDCPVPAFIDYYGQLETGYYGNE